MRAAQSDSVSKANTGLLMTLDMESQYCYHMYCDHGLLHQAIFILALIFSIIAVAAIIHRRKKQGRLWRLSTAQGCLPPRKIALKDPILGTDLLRDSYEGLKRHEYLQRARHRFSFNGRTFESNMIGASVINTIEPENIRTILSTKFDDYELGHRRKDAFVPLIGHGIFTADGPSWKHSRTLLRPNFSRNQIGDIPVLERHVTNLINRIPRDGSTVDLQKLFFRYTMDTGTELIFGKSTLSLLAAEDDENDGNLFAQSFSRSQGTMSQNYCIGRLANLIPDQQFRKDQKFIHAWVDRLVRKALKAWREGEIDVDTPPPSRSNSITAMGSLTKEPERYVFLHELAKQTEDPRQLRSELLNLLVAGRDTTASLLSNLWFMIARRPDVWFRLREEVDALDDEDLTLEHIKSMKYLNSCISESLRLHPPVPVNSRTAIHDTVLPLGGGPDGKSPVLVPKGTIVGYQLYAMHRRRDIYGEDSNEFRPERWTEANKDGAELRPGWGFLPFNGGPRACLGRQLALTEAGYATIRLIQEFKGCETRCSEPWHENLHLTLCSGNGTEVSLTPA